MSKAPSYFKPIFWSYDFSHLDADKDNRRVVINTINYGDWRHWQWIFSHYGRETVKQIIESVPATEFRAGALRLASLILSAKPSHEARSAYAGRR